MVRISLDDENYDASFATANNNDNAEWSVLQTPKRSQTIDSPDDADDAEDEVEPPHPLGFSSSLGRTRFSMDAEQEEDESMLRYKLQWGYLNVASHQHRAVLTSPTTQQFPPLHSYVDAETAPTPALLRYDYQQKRRQSIIATNDDDEDDPMDNIIMLLKASSIIHNESTLLSPIRQIEAIQQQMGLPQHVQQQREHKIQQRVDRFKAKFAQEQEEAAQALANLLQRQEQVKAQQEEEEEQKRQQDEQQRLEEDEKQRKQQQQDEEENERIQQEEKRQAHVQAQQQEDVRAAQDEQVARQRQEALQKSQEPDYIGRAKKLVADLVMLRASIEPFETSKALSKRRLGVKKIANGKVNTLTEDPAKVRSVAMEVSQAISVARAEDAEAKQRLEAQDPSVSAEMTRGKRYFLDFLCSKAIVRAQADGFNGQRGDGFPLANMLTLVSVENKDINPILAAHIYTVCPVAIPALPAPSKDASEDEFMESLGMLREKTGEFETFEKFISRTEGIISLMVDIMSAQPSTHTLMGGNEGAVKWLSRFLKLLPEAPVAPLPLLTAPVLDAFLSGAGHMLANLHGERFSQYLDVITNDIMNRLDVGPIGKPSSIRLQKTIEGGYNKFKSELPSKAMAELYLGSGSGGSNQASHSPPRLSVSQKLMGYTPSQRQSSSSSSFSSPFGQASGQSSQKSHPFGGPSNHSNPSPFGVSSNTGTAQSPFGSQLTSNQNQSPFGVASNNNSQSPFGSATQTSSNQSPFGTAPTQNQNTNPFGGPGGNSQSPFGANTSSFGIKPVQELGMQHDNGAHGIHPGNGFGSSAPAASPFGAPSSAFASSTNASPFGQPSNSPSPFGSQFGNNSGAGPMSNSTPFGQSSPFGAPTSTPFGSSGQPGGMFGSGAASSSPFGSSAPSNASPFGAPSQSGPSFNKPTHRKDNGGNKSVCKFFAQGRCRFGDNCRFSHDTGVGGGGGGGGGGFSSNNNNPFGGGQQNTFGGNSNAFGASSPFGGPRR